MAKSASASYLLFDSATRPGKSFKAKAVSKSSKRVGRNKALSESKSSKVSKCYDPYRGQFSVELEEDLVLGGIEEGSFSLSQSMSLSTSASLSLSFTTPIGKSGKSGGWSEGKASKSGRGKALKGGLDCDCLTTSSKSSKSSYGKSGKSGYGKSGKSRRILDYIPPTSSSKSGKSGSKTVKSKYSGRAPTCPPPRRTPRPVLVGITLVIASDDDITVLSTSPPIEIDVLSNDVGIGGSLIVSSVSLTSSPDSGTCAVDVDGTAVVYTPPVDPLFVGEATCTYEACLVGALEPSCDDAVVTITVLPEIDANDNVVSGVLSTSTGESIDVLANDVTAPVGLPLNVTAITTPPSFGSVVISDDMKEVIYTPPSSPLFVGDVTFEYEACTHEGSCDRANVTVSVVPEVDAVDDVYTVLPPISQSLDVLQNDVTTPAGSLLIVNSITTPPLSGTATIAVDNSAITYTPPSDDSSFIGETFEYETCFDNGAGGLNQCDIAMVTISVDPVFIDQTDTPTTLMPSDAPTSQVPTSQPLDPSGVPTTSLPTFTPSLQPTTESPTEVSSP